MTKLLHFGMSLDDVVRRSTAAPAKIMGYEGTVGTLKPGANADIAVFELRDGNFELRDSDGNTVTAEAPLLTQLTLKDGRVWVRTAGGVEQPRGTEVATRLHRLWIAGSRQVALSQRWCTPNEHPLGRSRRV